MQSIPEEIKYDREHVWIEMEDDFIGRCGITEHGLKNLDAIVFVEFPDVDVEVKRGVKIALLDSQKDYFNFISPVSGRITEINLSLDMHPEVINNDPYGEGWVCKIDVKEPRELEELMYEDEYLSYVKNSGDI